MVVAKGSPLLPTHLGTEPITGGGGYWRGVPGAHLNCTLAKSPRPFVRAGLGSQGLAQLVMLGPPSPGALPPGTCLQKQTLNANLSPPPPGSALVFAGGPWGSETPSPGEIGREQVRLWSV